MKMLPKVFVLAAVASLGATPALAQTTAAKAPQTQQALPPPAIVRPTTFGAGSGGGSPLDQVVLGGEYATGVHTMRDRITEPQRVLAERYAQEKALVAQRGAGKPVVLRKARY